MYIYIYIYIYIFIRIYVYLNMIANVYMRNYCTAVYLDNSITIIFKNYVSDCMINLLISKKFLSMHF